MALPVIALLAALPAPAAGATAEPGADPTADPGTEGSVTGLPVPRFVSLGSDKVNVRTGPGTRYPISWVYQRRGLPVEVIAEFELFRKIRDSDGTEGWVHKSLLSGKRWVLIAGTVRTLHRQPDAASPPVLLAEPGVQARLNGCQADWCEIRLAGYAGFVRRDWLYGVYPDEQIE